MRALGLLLALLLANSLAFASPVPNANRAGGPEPAPLFGYSAAARWALADPLLATSSRTDPTCRGNDGTITTYVSGGVPPYTYSWSNGATSPNLTGLAAGYYSVVVTDATGATARCFETLSEFMRIEAPLIEVTGVRCSSDATGSVTLQKFGGGTGPYTFLWSNGATTQNLSGVPAGTYTLTITDANGCTGTATATVPAAVSLVAVASRTDVRCGGAATGSINLAVSGGTGPYSYRWSNGATSQNLSGLAAGPYSVTVTDAGGCTSTATATILEPAPLQLSLPNPRPSCFGGTSGGVAVAVSGGTAPYGYLWSNGATAAALSGVSGGTYTVTVTDANGCSASGSATIAESTQITALASKTDATCYDAHNGTVALAVSGGTAPLTYLWSNGATTQNLTGVAPGTYTVTVTDANGCTAFCGATVGRPTQLLASALPTDARCAGGTGSVALTVRGGTAPYTYHWSNGATTQDLSNAPAGIYSVTVTDANSCTATATATVAQPDALALLTTLTNPSCCNVSTGGIDLAVSGGTGPYTYRWSNGATTQNVSGLPAGPYSVSVTDAHSCTASTSVTLTQPAALRASASSTNATCAGPDGTATAVASGGTPPYSYSWSPGGQTSATATGLGAGTYTVTVTDARGCTATCSTSLLAASCGAQHCTLTQGGYGNSNGVICKEPSKRRLQLIADMFTTSNLVLGAPGRSLTYSYAGGSSGPANLARLATAQCIIDKLPAGGTAAAFPSTLGNASGCASSFPPGFLRNGRFGNVLVGQTLTLALNLRLDNSLTGVPLNATMTSYATLNCASPDPSDLVGISRSMPAAVLGNLSYAGGTPTVGSLLALANKALGGVAYANGGGTPSISDINAAVGGINELFDECRMFSGSAVAARSAATGSLAPAVALRTAPADAGALAAFPNPFTANTSLTFALPVTAKYSLTVYDLKGSEVARVSSGEAQAGVRYHFAVGAGLQESVYVARLVTATGTQIIRLNLLH